MADAIDKLIQEVSFPREGELFSLVLLPFTRDVPAGMFGDTTEKVTVEDRSYRDSVFRCLASDALRVVAVRVFGGYAGDRPHIFYRPQCRFDDVSLIAPALGLTEPPPSNEPA
jgi:hypothetical protein